MAKTNMIERDKRRVVTARKYAELRTRLKETIRSPKSSPEERQAAQAKLQTLPTSVPVSWAWTDEERGWLRGTELEDVMIMKRDRMQQEHQLLLSKGFECSFEAYGQRPQPPPLMLAVELMLRY